MLVIRNVAKVRKVIRLNVGKCVPLAEKITIPMLLYQHCYGLI